MTIRVHCGDHFTRAGVCSSIVRSRMGSRELAYSRVRSSWITPLGFLSPMLHSKVVLVSRADWCFVLYAILTVYSRIVAAS